MTNDQIEKFLGQKTPGTPVQISFRTRKTITGVFIQTGDYMDLKSKNFWRIVGEASIEDYKRTKDQGLARIYNGTEFTKLGAG